MPSHLHFSYISVRFNSTVSTKTVDQGVQPFCLEATQPIFKAVGGRGPDY